MVRPPGRAAPGRSRPNRNAALRGSLPGPHTAAEAPRRDARLDARRGAPGSPYPHPGPLPGLSGRRERCSGPKSILRRVDRFPARSRLPPTPTTTPSLDQQRVETEGRSWSFPLSAIRVAFW